MLSEKTSKKTNIIFTGNVENNGITGSNLLVSSIFSPSFDNKSFFECIFDYNYYGFNFYG